MLIAYSGVSPLHLTPGCFLMYLQLVWFYYPCKVVLGASSKRCELFTASSYICYLETTLNNTNITELSLGVTSCQRVAQTGAWSHRRQNSMLMIVHTFGLMRRGWNRSLLAAETPFCQHLDRNVYLLLCNLSGSMYNRNILLPEANFHIYPSYIQKFTKQFHLGCRGTPK